VCVCLVGLTLQQSTDINYLSQELEKLDQHYKELSLSHRTRYEPTSIRESLKTELDHKVEQKEKLEVIVIVYVFRKSPSLHNRDSLDSV